MFPSDVIIDVESDSILSDGTGFGSVSEFTCANFLTAGDRDCEQDWLGGGVLCFYEPWQYV